MFCGVDKVKIVNGQYHTSGGVGGRDNNKQLPISILDAQ